MQNPKIKLKLICFASYKEQKVTVIEEGGGGERDCGKGRVRYTLL